MIDLFQQSFSHYFVFVWLGIIDAYGGRTKQSNDNEGGTSTSQRLYKRCHRHYEFSTSSPVEAEGAEHSMSERGCLPRCGRRTSPQRRGGGEGDPPLQVGQLSLMQCRPVLAVVEGDWDPFPICVTRGSSCQDSFCRINVLSGRRRMRSSTGWSALLMDQN